MSQSIYNFNAGGQNMVGGAVETIVFNSSEIASDQVAGFYLTVDNADTISSITRVRIKSSGTTIYDVSLPELLAYFQRASRSNFTANPAVDQSLSVPLYILDSSGSERYAAGFPRSQACTVEVVRDATGTAGRMFCGWRLWTTPFPFYSVFTGTQSNIAGAAVNFRVPISAPGLLRYWGLPMDNLLRARLVVSGQQLVDMSRDQLLESQQMEGLDGATPTLGQFQMFKLDSMIPVSAGNSYLELETGAGWSATDEVAFYTLVPQVDPNARA